MAGAEPAGPTAPHAEAAPGAGGPALAAAAAAALASLARQDRLRTLVVAAPSAGAGSAPRAGPGSGSGCCDLTHNDYLGLRDDPEHQALLRASLGALPSTAGASRLLGGEHPVFAALEAEFAAFKGAPTALYFASGYAANEGLIAALAALPGTAFFSDALNHASLIDGFRLARLTPERMAIFRHNDAAHLETLLQRSTAAVNVIVTETVFSMDGDLAPLQELAALAARYRGVLVLDEAHAVFALGDGGRGLAPPGAITVNTCGKALAAQGALVAGPEWLRAWLINKARPFIYSTGPSPWLAQALRTTLARAPVFAGRRARLAAVAAQVRAGLAAAGRGAGASSTHIVPLVLGDDRAAVEASVRLATQGFLVRAVRPPTVPEGTARLRLSLHAGLDEQDAARLLHAIKDL